MVVVDDGRRSNDTAAVPEGFIINHGTTIIDDDGAQQNKIDAAANVVGGEINP